MRKTDPGAPVSPTIQVIERMFSLIDVLASREEAVSLKEISEKTGLHPSTTHRILNDLATGRFVDRPEAGSYRLGMRLLELGDLVKARQYGIARDNEELELGVRCMAAGIYDDQSKLVAGLSISAPADRLDEGWLSKLQATANEISSALGHKTPSVRAA